MSTAAVILGLALAAEGAVGDPVTRWHPVALAGRWIEAWFRVAPRSGPARQLAYGAAVTVVSVAGAGFLTQRALRLLRTHHRMVGLVAAAALLKTCFSYRQLEAEALRVAAHLEAGRLAAARTDLRALVGRDTAQLSATLAASAAVESLAENLSDSVVAPLLYYVMLGVPGAAAYRVINTFDAMVGYHGEYEYLGRAAAKLDDLANWIPARLTAALLLLAAVPAGAGYQRTLGTAWRDHERTESPNAGWPMATMAGALAVQLEKPGHYRLGDPASQPSAATIRRAVAITRRAALMAAVIALAIAAVR